MMAPQQSSKDHNLLAVYVPISKPLPDDSPQILPRVAGFPARTKLGESTYTRRTFDHVNFQVQDSAIVPSPNVTRQEHLIEAFRELRQNREYFGEAWVQDERFVQDEHCLKNMLVNRDDHCGSYNSYYEGVDSPVPDLQQSRAEAHAGSFTKSYAAGHYDTPTIGEDEDVLGQKTVRLLPLSSEVRQMIYHQLLLSGRMRAGVLLPLASTCRLLRAEVITFQRAKCGFAFRNAAMLRKFLQNIEPSSILLKHKENMLAFGCIMIDLRSQLTSCPTKTVVVNADVNTKTCRRECCRVTPRELTSDQEETQEDSGSENDELESFYRHILDKINLDIMQLPRTRKGFRPDPIYQQAVAHFGVSRRLLPPSCETAARRHIDESKLSDWYDPMMRLLKGYRIRKLVIRRDGGSWDEFAQCPEMVECLLGFVNKKHTMIVLENVGGWSFDTLEYDREDLRGAVEAVEAEAEAEPMEIDIEAEGAGWGTEAETGAGDRVALTADMSRLLDLIEHMQPPQEKHGEVLRCSRGYQKIWATDSQDSAQQPKLSEVEVLRKARLVHFHGK